MMQTTFISDNESPFAPGGKGPMDISAAQVIGDKTSAVVSITTISLFVIVIVLQIKLQVGCWAAFRQRQMGHVSGRALFIIFVIALCLSVTTCVLFNRAMLDEGLLPENHYSWSTSNSALANHDQRAYGHNSSHFYRRVEGGILTNHHQP